MFAAGLPSTVSWGRFMEGFERGSERQDHRVLVFPTLPGSKCLESVILGYRPQAEKNPLTSLVHLCLQISQFSPELISLIKILGKAKRGSIYTDTAFQLVP